MPFVRLIHRDHYDPNKGYFQDFAFKAPRRGLGISVVERDCANGLSTSICEHITTRYPPFASPPIFWQLPDGLYPIDRFAPDASEGDPCHYNIEPISAGHTERIRKAIRVDDCETCEGERVRPLTLADLPPNPYPRV